MSSQPGDIESGPNASPQQQGGMPPIIDTVKQQFVNIPAATKVMMSVVIGFLILGFVVPQPDVNLTLNATTLMPSGGMKLWTVFTAPFYESSFISSILDIFLVVFIGQYFERLWGSNELLRFFLTVSLGSSFILLVVLLLLYPVGVRVTADDEGVSGMMAALTGFLVGLKQLIPEQEQRLPLCGISLRAKHYAPIAVVISLFLVLIAGLGPFFLTITGLIVSWVYLRYFQKRPGTTTPGDRSDAFAFRTFFPQAVQPAIAFIERLFGRVSGGSGSSSGSAIGGQTWAQAVTAAANARAPLDATVLSGSNGDIERRRSLALKALDQRMSELGISAPTTSPEKPQQIVTSVGTSGNTQANTTDMVHPPSLSSPPPAGAPAGTSLQIVF